ncbi:MAG TPA: hypothetical protein VJ806_02810 [Luteimonas sp.]|nr:hypothetical protein [Luteimonas sp.]
MDTNEKGFWSGVAEVIPRTGNHLLEGADGAYVGVVGIAASEAEFLDNSRIAFNAMNFDLLELEDVEFIDSVEKWMEADEVMRERVSALSDRNPIEFGSFHTFKD